MGGARAIVGDLHCIHCGYNLRGLTSASRCPECGRFAADTIRGSTLYRSSAAALRTVAAGLFLLAGCGVMTAATVLAVREPWLAMISFGAGGGRQWLLLMAISDHRGALVFFLAVGAGAIHVVATFLCTSTAGLAPIPQSSSDLRLALRILAGIGFAMFVGGVCSANDRLRSILGVVLFLLEMGQSFLLLSYVRDIALMAGFYRRGRLLRVLRLWPPFRILSHCMIAGGDNYLWLALPVLEVLVGVVAAVMFVLLGRSILRAGRLWPYEWVQAALQAESEAAAATQGLSTLSDGVPGPKRAS